MGTTPDDLIAPEQIPAEDEWEVPPSWWREVTPVRGVDEVAPPSLDVDAARVVVAGMVAAAGDRIRHSSTAPDLRAAGLDALGEAPRKGLFRRAQEPGPTTPLGLAVVAAGGLSHVQGVDDELRAQLVVWWQDHSPQTAVLALLELGGLQLYTKPQTGVLRMGPQYWDRGVMATLLSLLQHLVAASDDATNAAVEDVFETRRHSPDECAIAAYLCPGRRDWVRNAITRPSERYWQLVLSVVTSAEDATTLLGSFQAWGNEPAVTSLAVHCGPSVAPLLLDRVDQGETGRVKQSLRLLSAFRTDEALGGMIARLATKGVFEHVLVAKERQPFRAARLLAAAAVGGGTDARAVEALLRSHLAAHPATRAVGALLTSQARAALDRAVPREDTRPVATADQLPPVLVRAPWERRRSTVKPVVVSGLAAQVPASLEWLDGERDRCRTRPEPWMLKNFGGSWDRVLSQARGGRLRLLAAAPADVGRAYLQRLNPLDPNLYAETSAVLGLLANYDVEALGDVTAIARRSSQVARALLPAASAEIAQLMADWMARSRSVRPVAGEWFTRHPQAAALALVPPALGKAGKERRAAERALRFLAARDPAVVEQAAATYGPQASAGITAMLSKDPWEVLPAKVPALPAWLDAHSLPAVLLADRSARLPAEAVGRLLTGLQLSEPGEPWAGIQLAAPALDATSLAECVWAVLQMWRLAGEPPKDTWVLNALSLVGDDESARRLSPLISAWPKQGGTRKANLGIEVLAAIGSDVALMHLHRIATRTPSKPLREKAGELIQRIADERGLTAEQLADRLVPDLGLDPDGRLLLDYGPRQFAVGFDESLKPFVEEDGRRRPTLPKPGAKDDEQLAGASYALFAGLKKDVRTVATDQLRRFEQAMATQRRWSAADQRSLFVDHPLMWHLARRVVWAVFDGGRAVSAFRVAEDRTLADRDDEQLDLADDATVGIAHPLHLGDHLGTWAELFADYEVLQPFPQLGREVLRLTPEELAGTEITRFAEAKVETKKIYGLAHRGWERSDAADGGMQVSLEKQLPGGLIAVARLNPGIIIGMPDEWPEQQLEQVQVVTPGTNRWNQGPPVPLSDLDDVTASEILRDLTRVTG